jgi:hypothetical protein
MRLSLNLGLLRGILEDVIELEVVVAVGLLVKEPIVLVVVERVVVLADDEDEEDKVVVRVEGGAVIGTLLGGFRLAELSEVPPPDSLLILGLAQGGRSLAIGSSFTQL